MSDTAAKPTTPLMTAMLEGLFDFAGLFPPAELSMETAARQYHEHLQCEHSWILGKFVLPVDRLEEFAAEAQRFAGGASGAWQLSLLTADWKADCRQVVQFAAAQNGKFDVKSIETRNGDALSGDVPMAVDAYVELIVSGQLRAQIESQIESLSAQGVSANAKIRTGGLETSAFPSAVQVADFLTTAASRGVACKATAGLHHALASVRKAHDGEDAPTVSMHGFVNVVLANALIRQGANTAAIVELLRETNGDAFRFGNEQVTWRNHVFTTADLQSCRAHMFHAIGSCSFSEPVCDLQQLGWL